MLLESLKSRLIDEVTVFNEVFIETEELDLSEKVSLLYFSLPFIGIDDNKKSEIAIKLFEEFSKYDFVYNQRLPLTLYYCYPRFRDEKGSFDWYFNSILDIEDNKDFFNIITKNLLSISIEDDKEIQSLSFQILGYSTHFLNNLKKRIYNLPETMQTEIFALISKSK